MDEIGAYYTEWSKPERKTSIQYTNTYIWNIVKFKNKIKFNIKNEVSQPNKKVEKKKPEQTFLQRRHTVG